MLTLHVFVCAHAMEVVTRSAVDREGLSCVYVQSRDNNACLSFDFTHVQVNIAYVYSFDPQVYFCDVNVVLEFGG